MSMLDDRVRTRTQALSSAPRPHSDLERERSLVGRTPSAPVVIAYASAACFIAASGATNALYGWARGTDLPSSIVWAAVSIAASLGLALAWPAMLSSLARRKWSNAVVAFVALALFGTYSVAAALGSATGGRLTAAHEEKETADVRQRTTVRLQDARQELLKLPDARPAAEVRALIPPLRGSLRGADCAGWVKNTTARATCIKIAELEAEAARADRRAELAREIATLTDRLTNVPSARPANTDAVALSTFLAAIGVHVGTDRMNNLLVLLAILTIELGGGLSLATGLALKDASGTQMAISALPMATSTGDPDLVTSSPSLPNSPEADPAITSTPTQEAVPEHRSIIAPAELIANVPNTRPDRSRLPSADASQDQADRASAAFGKRPRKASTREAVEARIANAVGAVRGTGLSLSMTALAKLVNASRTTTHAAVREMIERGTLARADDGALVMVS